MNQQELVERYNHYSTIDLSEEIRILGAKLASMDQRFGLLPKDAPIDGKRRTEFLEIAENIAAIVGVLSKRL